MRTFTCGGLIALAAVTCFASPASAQEKPAGELRIVWEVKNRFRLFRNDADFQRHAVSMRNDGVLGSEARLAEASDGRGWAGDLFEHLCTNRAGNLLETCERDGTKENYLAPDDHLISLVLAGSFPAGATCAWRIEDGASQPRTSTAPCEEDMNLRVASGHTTMAAVDVTLPDGTIQHAVTDIAVKDYLIAGLGDSIAAGEGNPDQPVNLSDGGFCFRRFGTGSEYYRPGRAGFEGNKTCLTTPQDGAGSALASWARHGARWMSAPCHRSLYGYQVRAALALAVENPQIAVTFIPLACTGATIENGLLGSQTARECANPAQASSCSSSVGAQVEALKRHLARARKSDNDRKLDLILLTVGANDINFSGLVADVIVDASTERTLFSDVMTSAADADRTLTRSLPGNFVKLRAALKPLVDGDLSRVVYVSYGNPALQAPDTPCSGGRDGFDIHPAFNADPDRLKRAAEFVANRFLPRLKALAQCADGVICRDAATETMTFVDAHQPAFAEHGFCARGAADPSFDRDCISPEGESFRTGAEAATDPMACGESASEFRPYASRQRWVRTADDSYFTAMTYPDGMPATLRPADIHDATWAVLAAVYGGAIHPTAQGHAAMADAALPAVRSLLGLPAPSEVASAPLAPLDGAAPSPPPPQQQAR